MGFSATVHHKELRFLALLSVRPGASFMLSKTPLGRFKFVWVKWRFGIFFETTGSQGQMS